MSAIKQEISPATLFAEIKLQRAVHKGSFALVEGDTDSRFYAQLIDDDRCAIINCINKDNVENTILLLDAARFSGAVGIVDGDFAEVSNDNAPSPNIVMTHGNDVEMMILNSPALDKVLLHCGSVQKINVVCSARGATLRHIIALEAAKIGVVRLASKRRGWNLKFKDMSYHFVTNAGFQVDVSRIRSHVLARSGVGAPTPTDLQQECEAIVSLGYDAMHLSNGHDYVRILARAFKRDIGSTNTYDVDCSLLEKLLRVGYERAYFLKTSTYAAIKNWEKLNTPYLVLSA
ncbi:DUF4435 domain-containing protein [Rhizobium sp. 22-785-1]